MEENKNSTQEQPEQKKKKKSDVTVHAEQSESGRKYE